MPIPRLFKARTALSAVPLLLAACQPPHFRATFNIILSDPVYITASPMPAGGGRGTDGSGSGASGPTSPSAGGAGGGGSAPAPGLAIALATEGLFDVAGIAGDATGGNALGSDAAHAAFRRIAGVVAAPDGTVYASDPLNHQVRAVPPGGGPTVVVAGALDGGPGFTGDNLPAAAVRLDGPVGLARDAATGVLFIADSNNRRIRAFVPGGRIYTYAGGGIDASDDVAVPTTAALQHPWGVAADARGRLYFTERDSGKVRRVDANGALSTVATLTPGQVGPIAASSQGDRLWVGDGGRVRLVLPGATTIVDPAPTVDVAGAEVTGLASDQLGTLYVARRDTGGTGSGVYIQRVHLDAAGRPLAGRVPETIAGTGAPSVGAEAHVGASAVPDARTQTLAGAGDCSLAIDTYQAADPAVLSGILYAGGSFDDGATRWGQVLRLAPSSP